MLEYYNDGNNINNTNTNDNHHSPLPSTANTSLLQTLTTNAASPTTTRFLQPEDHTNPEEERCLSSVLLSPTADFPAGPNDTTNITANNNSNSDLSESRHQLGSRRRRNRRRPQRQQVATSEHENNGDIVMTINDNNNHDEEDEDDEDDDDWEDDHYFDNSDDETEEFYEDDDDDESFQDDSAAPHNHHHRNINFNTNNAENLDDGEDFDTDLDASFVQEGDDDQDESEEEEDRHYVNFTYPISSAAVPATRPQQSPLTSVRTSPQQQQQQRQSSRRTRNDNGNNMNEAAEHDDDDDDNDFDLALSLKALHETLGSFSQRSSHSRHGHCSGRSSFSVTASANASPLIPPAMTTTTNVANTAPGAGIGMGYGGVAASSGTSSPAAASDSPTGVADLFALPHNLYHDHRDAALTNLRPKACSLPPSPHVNAAYTQPYHHQQHHRNLSTSASALDISLSSPLGRDLPLTNAAPAAPMDSPVRITNSTPTATMTTPTSYAAAASSSSVALNRPSASPRNYHHSAPPSPSYHSWETGGTTSSSNNGNNSAAGTSNHPNLLRFNVDDFLERRARASRIQQSVTKHHHFPHHHF